MNRQTVGKTTSMLAAFLVLVILSLVFITVVCYYNYVVAYNEMKQEYYRTMNEQIISEMETSLQFGKRIDHYYGMEELLSKSLAQYPKGFEQAVVDNKGTLLYTAGESKHVPPFSEIVTDKKYKYLLQNEGEIEKGIDTSFSVQDCNVIVQEVLGQDEKTTAYLLTAYQKDIAAQSLATVRKSTVHLTCILCTCSIVLLIALFLFVGTDKRFQEEGYQKKIRKISALVIIVPLLVQSVLLVNLYQQTYRSVMMESGKGIITYMKNSLDELAKKGVGLQDISDMESYLAEKSENPIFQSIRIIKVYSDSQESMKKEGGFVESVPIKMSDGKPLQIQAEYDQAYYMKELFFMVLIFAGTAVIVFTVSLEILRGMGVVSFRRRKGFLVKSDERYENVAALLRLGSFTTNLAEYLCLAFSAMLIRDLNQPIFGLSVGMTAALSVAVCTLAQAVGMLAVPLLCRRISHKRVLLYSGLCIIVANVLCFASYSSLMIILLRAISGLSAAGTLSVINFIAINGYEKEWQREKNLTENNAGVIGGIMVGSSLGTIIGIVSGYHATFLAGAIVEIFFVGSLFYLTPWKLLAENDGKRSTSRVKLVDVWAAVKRPSVIKYFIFLVFPVYFYLMVVVYWVPALVQTNELPGIVLTYVYLLNGAAGLYIGSRAVGYMSNRFGNRRCLYLVTALGAVSIFILGINAANAFAILTAGVFLGLLDGGGVPITQDYYLQINTGRQGMDGTTALALFSIFSSLVMSLAPFLSDFILEVGEKFTYIIPAFAFGMLLLPFIGLKHKKYS